MVSHQPPILTTIKLTACSIALIFFFGCGKPSETNPAEESTGVAEEESTTVNSEPLIKFLNDFEVGREALPSIAFIKENESTTYRVEYFFEDDNLAWMEREEMANEGGDNENYLLHRDPEGDSYLHYATKGEGTFGDGEAWYLVRVDDSYEPYIVAPGPEKKFDYQSEFEEKMKVVRENKDKFRLTNGYYSYKDQNVTYRFSEVLFTSNLLSSTNFDAAMIQPYLNWWYPLYEDASGKLYRHRLCSGDEAYIKITVEAGNYRWEEETPQGMLVYSVTGFEESEGDAFYATIERNGNRLKKTLIITENDSESDRLLIDGRVYTKTPANYDIVALKCD